MAYNTLTQRTDAAALIPEEVSTAILNDVVAGSPILNKFLQVRMSRKQTRLPVVATLPLAYFVNGEAGDTGDDFSDQGLKQTTKMSWKNKYLNAEELAVIVPIPEAVLDDADYDLWGQIQPKVVEAIQRKVESAVIFDVDKPATWGTAIVAHATAASHTVARGTNTAAEGGLAQDLSDVFSQVEEDGYDVGLVLAKTNVKGLLRGARDANGVQFTEVSPTSVYGVGVDYPARGLWTGTTEAVVADPTQAIVGLRQDITVKVLDQAVLTDATGNVVLNLAQQDMVALRVVFRCAWQVANTYRHDNPNESDGSDPTDRSPFAVLTSPASS